MGILHYIGKIWMLCSALIAINYLYALVFIPLFIKVKSMVLGRELKNVTTQDFSFIVIIGLIAISPVMIVHSYIQLFKQGEKPMPTNVFNAVAFFVGFFYIMNPIIQNILNLIWS